MKYGKYWKTQIADLPQQLQQTSLSYKNWKKIEGNDDNSLPILTKQCTIASKTIIEYIKNDSKPLSIFQCKRRTFNISQLYQYALLNKETLYKICKRLDKKNNSSQYKRWLREHYNDFAFNSGIYYKKIELENNRFSSSLEECPICLEEINDKTPFFITNCGHMICYPCTLLMFNITPKYRGRISVLINRRILYGSEQCCPVCRSATFMNELKYINVWPTQCKSILDKINH
jgi:hypothetical protein